MRFGTVLQKYKAELLLVANEMCKMFLANVQINGMAEKKTANNKESESKSENNNTMKSHVAAELAAVLLRNSDVLFSNRSTDTGYPQFFRLLVFLRSVGWLSTYVSGP